MIAEVTIQAAYRDGSTYLQHGYNTPPFKIADITEDKKAGVLQLMLMSSSPGILDGDSYTIKITLAENCRMQLHTQSYQRLFHMKTGATQLMTIHLQKGASFVFLPHPTVPHEQSVFTSHNKIYLQQHCRLVYGEVLTCGRKLNGELFHFSKYHSITEIFIHDRLVIKENLLVQPALTDVYTLGQWENYTHQASLVCLNDTIDIANCIEAIHDYLSKEKDIAFGVSAAPGNGCIARLLGFKAEQLHDCLKNIAAIIANIQPVKTIQHVA